MGERDRMYAANPKTRYIGAHFDWYGNDLARAAKQLDQLPNLVLEVGAVLYDFGRQPRAAREFFIKYQDRILFGKDSYQASEFPYYWRVFETADEYFDYYRDYHAFWKLYGMDLPDAVLKKLYYQNALRVTPGLAADRLAALNLCCESCPGRSHLSSGDLRLSSLRADGKRPGHPQRELPSAPRGRRASSAGPRPPRAPAWSASRRRPAAG